MRAIRHLFDLSSAKRHFPPATLDSIQHAIAASEHRHRGEIAFAVEGNLPFAEVLRSRGARERAHAAFARLRVWNTEHNTGVLVYLLLADHAIEIVADRGIAARVSAAEWQAICDRMRERYARGQWREGSLQGIADAHALLARHFPGQGESNPDELPDRPVLL